jgi:hypothetical protein
VDFALQTITTKHSEAVRELAEHLDCRDDSKALQMLDEVLDYEVMMIRFLNDRLRKHYVSTE